MLAGPRRLRAQACMCEGSQDDHLACDGAGPAALKRAAEYYRPVWDVPYGENSRVRRPSRHSVMTSCGCSRWGTAMSDRKKGADWTTRRKAFPGKSPRRSSADLADKLAKLGLVEGTSHRFAD